MDEDPAEVVGVLLDAVIERLDLFLVEEAQDALLQLTASLAGDDLDEPHSLRNRLVDDGSKGTVDIVASVVDLVQIELEPHDNGLHRREQREGGVSSWGVGLPVPTDPGTVHAPVAAYV